MNCPSCKTDLKEWVEALIAAKRSELARKAGLARSSSMTPSQRIKLARMAGRASRRVSRKAS